MGVCTSGDAPGAIWCRTSCHSPHARIGNLSSQLSRPASSASIISPHESQKLSLA